MPAGSPRSVDALVQIAASFLDGKRDTAPVGQRERYQLVLHATSEQLARDDDQAADVITSDGVRLHPETSRRLTRDCPTSTLTGDEDGSPLHLGRRTRRIRGRVARAVHYRDHGCCQAPGCTAAATISRHIRHRARGGTTCLINLISLCDGHHWLVHDGGWTSPSPDPAPGGSTHPTADTSTPTTPRHERSGRYPPTRPSHPTPSPDTGTAKHSSRVSHGRGSG
jgi:hypothetical protein